MKQMKVVLMFVVFFVLVWIGACFAATIDVQFPIAGYAENDGCLEWGGLNSNFRDQNGNPKQHVADDLCKLAGTKVYAIANGTVRYARDHGECPDNWGFLIVTEHTLSDGSQISAIYGHVEPLVEVNTVVNKGQLIGIVAEGVKSNGQTCWSDHIHFGIYNGIFTYGTGDDPYPVQAAGYLTQTAWPGNYLDPIRWIKDKAIEYRHSTPHAGSTVTDIIGQKDGNIHRWYTPANPITNEIVSSGDAKGMSQNTYVQEYAGKSCTLNGTAQFCDGVIVYDALGGARSAYLVWYQQFGGYSGVGGWYQFGGPRSTSLRNPITNSYWSPANNCWRQDFQMGWLCYEVWHGYDSGDVAPGIYDPWGNIFSDVRRWDPATSYAFAEAYERNGAAVNLGSTFDDGGSVFVHNWNGIRIQNFNGGNYGSSAIIYNSATGDAYSVKWGFWDYYRFNNGPQILGAPNKEEQVDRCPHQACQLFDQGYLSWEYGYGIFPIYWTTETRAFMDAYARYGKASLGPARDDGGGIFIHDWIMHGYTIRLQNFGPGNWGNSALIYNPIQNKAYSVKWGFWDYYRYYQGPEFLGAPFEDEHPKNTGGCIYEACQKFERGTLVWDYSGAGIRIVPNFY